MLVCADLAHFYGTSESTTLLNEDVRMALQKIM